MIGTHSKNRSKIAFTSFTVVVDSLGYQDTQMAANGATSASNEKANLEATDVASLSSAQHAEEAPRGSQDDWTVEEENAIR